MKKIIPFIALAVMLAACGSNDRKLDAEPDSDITTAEAFIRSALDGKFDKARGYMYPDSVNNNFMDVAERNFQKADQKTKNGYRESSIIIHDVDTSNKGYTIVVYSNSFKKDHDTLRVVKSNNKWLVDLKYLYQHDMDTLKIPVTPSKDSMP